MNKVDPSKNWWWQGGDGGGDGAIGTACTDGGAVDCCSLAGGNLVVLTQ